MLWCHHIRRVYVFCQRMCGNTETVRNNMAMHGLLRAVVAKEREIVN